jgi:hypothetical protein
MVTVVHGKGDQQAMMCFSLRSFGALKDYPVARAAFGIVNGQRGNKRVEELPLFARHDRGGGRMTRCLSTIGAREAIERRVAQAMAILVDFNLQDLIHNKPVIIVKKVQMSIDNS